MFSIGFFFIVILVVLIFLYFILRIKNQQTGNKSHRTVSYIILGFLTVAGLYYPWRYNNRISDSHNDASKEKLKEYKKSSSKKSSSRRSKR